MPGERALYDRLWDEALASFRAGQVEIDPLLDRREFDNRRGLTLAVRPDGAALGRLSGVLDDLRALAPEQHIYRPDELHITVLSVISAAPGFDPARAPVNAYKSLFEALFAAAAPFTVQLRGLTASRSCVLICGHSPEGALNALRDRLRAGLRAAGLADGLELRYRSTAAHITALRFRVPPANLDALAGYIAARRDADYGPCPIHTVEFVVNDWTMSHDRVRLLARYTLGGRRSKEKG